ncbi:ABC transporter ATP-binding protein [Streptomyces erythrochromogenes]|uniref:ABC transporter ATP-binding protein n=1 Tax=Streptomyces erythrochromogenes TaxID=285574 RepID=UPI0034412C48
MQSGAAENVITATDVWRRYGPAGSRGFDAVRGVSFTVRRGEVFGLLGTNGAGKTSTLELLEGLARPSRGTVRLFGADDPVRDRARIRPRTGVMLQEGGFISELTVSETLRMWGGCTTGPRPAADALAMTGLTGRADVQVKSLSGGERRRLDLALAVLGSPELLFLDEPTTGMDPEGRQETWDIIKDLQGRGTSIVLTTHYLEEAEALADRIAIMHAGRVALAGTVAEITDSRPSTLVFRLPPGSRLADLGSAARLGAEEVLEEAGGRIRLGTRDLQHTATEVLLAARERSLALTDLHARSASLDEVFLDLARSGGGDELGDELGDEPGAVLGDGHKEHSTR